MPKYLVTDTVGGTTFDTDYDPAGRFGENVTWVKVEDQDTQWLIDIGPLFDRFGLLQIAILANPDNENQAVIKTIMARKYIDLQRADIPQMMAIIKSKNPGIVTDALIASVLTTPVAPHENSSLRKLYFS
jgi:hypothetical protein